MSCEAIVLLCLNAFSNNTINTDGITKSWLGICSGNEKWKERNLPGIRDSILEKRSRISQIQKIHGITLISGKMLFVGLKFLSSFAKGGIPS